CQHVTDLLVRQIFEVVQHERGTITFVNLAKRIQHCLCVDPIHHVSRYMRKILCGFIDWFIRNTFPTTADFEKLPMQCCEKPAFDVRGVSKLVSFVRPDVKGFLGKVSGIDFASGETEAESVKIAVI